MADYTNNYNLIKPLQDENYDVNIANTNNTIMDNILYGKVDKVHGKGLSTNDFTDGYKKKIDSMQTLYRFKGTVKTTNDLSFIEDRNVGDTYKCMENSNTYIWNGLEWINVGQDGDYSQILEQIDAYQEEVNAQINNNKEELNTQISNVNKSISNKVDKIEGKNLSTNDFTNKDKQKLDDIEFEANKTVINNTLTSTSVTEALSATQGKVLNDKIMTLKGTILYENNNGITETVTLSETAANFNYLEIFYKDANGNGEYSSAKVFKSNGKNVALSILSQSKYNVNSLRYATKTAKIEGTTISNLSNIVGYIEDGSFQIYDTAEISILAVVGYR